MRLCAALPYGDRLYKVGQKRFGRLRAKPMERLPMQAKMARWLQDAGVSVGGARLFEVGAGHVPIAPVGFFLCGSEQVITVDLHRRIDWSLTRDSLQWIAAHRSEVWALYDGVVSERVFNDRFATLGHLAHEPQRFLKEAGIDYLAPMNAAATGLPDHSVDYHFSLTTLEHIPLQDIRDIFTEAGRILTRGVALHFVDLSDHFQHQDISIMRINFLRYGEAEWQRIAGNEFAYCNRLRASDYLALFQQLDFTVDRHEIDVDQELLSHLQKKSFSLDERFASYTPDDICSTSLRILLRKRDD